MFLYTLDIIRLYCYPDSPIASPTSRDSWKMLEVLSFCSLNPCGVEGHHRSNGDMKRRSESAWSKNHGDPLRSAEICRNYCRFEPFFCRDIAAHTVDARMLSASSKRHRTWSRQRELDIMLEEIVYLPLPNFPCQNLSEHVQKPSISVAIMIIIMIIIILIQPFWVFAR